MLILIISSLFVRVHFLFSSLQSHILIYHMQNENKCYRRDLLYLNYHDSSTSKNTPNALVLYQKHFLFQEFHHNLVGVYHHIWGEVHDHSLINFSLDHQIQYILYILILINTSLYHLSLTY